MVNSATGISVIVAGKVAAVTADTLTAASNCRGFKRAIGCCVMTGGATVSGMDLSIADEWCVGGYVTADAIGC